QPTEENRVEATCAAAGSYDLVTRCTHCGVILSSDTITLPTPDHTWDEGKVTTEPTQVPHGEKTYTCTVCGETRVEKLEHVHSYTDNIIRPTCEKPGYTEHTCACGRRYEDDHVKALGHDYEEGLCTVCGGKDPTYRPPVEEADRCAGADRFSTALLAADRMKENLGLEKFDAVVVASGTNFADALSGSYLATVMDAPILLTYTTDKVNDPIKEYIRENLIKGGTVYILGGTGAVPESFEDGLYGFRVKRLAGESRFETNLKILEEAGVEDQPILVCTGLNFADSLSASATKLPVLLVWNELSKEQTAFLESLSGNKIYILGGEGAVSAKMHKQLSYYSPVTRLGGRDRFETSAMIAREFFEEPTSAVLAYAWNFPDGLCGGPLAASMNAPLLLTMEGYEKYAAAYTKVNSITDGIVLGGESLIPETTASLIFQQ
ncbi:MAG: cell wall-binding repeat-containing protein, partial [Clostridia bacterium]|nr:cell wall-binding repeat-containing protein [Clostridia bacterium]